jgi:excisionase family DNA binding protein
MKTQEQEEKKEFLDVPKAAEYLSLAVSTVYKLIHYKKIRHFKPNGNKVYFLKSDLTEHIMKNCILSNDQIEAEAQNYL